MERCSRAEIVSLWILDKERETCFLLLTLMYLLRQRESIEPLFFSRVYREIEGNRRAPFSMCDRPTCWIRYSRAWSDPLDSSRERNDGNLKDTITSGDASLKRQIVKAFLSRCAHRHLYIKPRLAGLNLSPSVLPNARPLLQSWAELWMYSFLAPYL